MVVFCFFLKTTLFCLSELNFIFMLSPQIFISLFLGSVFVVQVWGKLKDLLMQWQPAINHLFCDSYFMCQVAPGCSFESKNVFFYKKSYCMQYVNQRRADVYISCPYFSSLHLNVVILTPLLLSSCCRDFFLDKDWTKGERPMSTETAVLLYGGRSNHPFWRNQVRHSAWIFFWIYQND